MKEIWVMRHAKSEWSHPDLTDFDRPLNKRGKRDAPRMGEWIRLYGSPPELIVSSPAKRAKATTRAVADVMGTKAPLQWWDELYPGDVDTTMKRIRQLSNEIDRIMVVGHNPHRGIWSPTSRPTAIYGCDCPPQLSFCWLARSRAGSSHPGRDSI